MKITNYLVQQDLHEFLFDASTKISMSPQKLKLYRECDEAEYIYISIWRVKIII